MRALPVCGYVSFPRPLQPAVCNARESNLANAKHEGHSEQPESDEGDIPHDDPDLLQNRPPLQRAFVICAGVVMNFLLAYFALLGSACVNGISVPVQQSGVVVPAIVDVGGAGARGGLSPGDVILEVDGTELPTAADAAERVARMVRAKGGKPIHLRIERSGAHAPLELDIVPDVRAGVGVIGVQLCNNVAMDKLRPTTLRQVLEISSTAFFSILKQTLDGFVQLFSNVRQADRRLMGPVGIAKMGADAGQQGKLLVFVAMMSINLGLVNALPIPHLDGGQLMRVLLEALRGRPLNPQLVRVVSGVFLAALLGLSATALLADLAALLPR